MVRERPLALVLALALAGAAVAPSAAADCPAKPPEPEERAALLANLAAAPTELEGRIAADAVRRFWAAAPDAHAQALIDRVFERRRWYDLEATEAAARELVAYCPDFAEGWNQLATVLYERGRLDASLAAVDRVLELEPSHFGALSGRGLILMGQGRTAPAQRALRQAAAIHPWMAERALILPEPAPSQGQPL